VLATLHANDAASTITRLIDIGVPPFLVGSSLILVMAQRLIRRICGECKEPVALTEQEKLLLNLKPGENREVFQGKGCTKCRQTGYYGRIGIFELMPIHASIRQRIFENANQDVIRAAALAQKMKTLRESALDKLFAGVTSVHEVLKTTVSE
jgi:type II secretory ATPase GspE/PulE/Tfp pilus assembly ATPase PilB-like protein